MSKKASEVFKEWFDKLENEEQSDVLRLVYGSSYRKIPLKEGTYCGPAPGMIKKGGLYTGPAPSGMASTTSVCPTCGRSY